MSCCLKINIKGDLRTVSYRSKQVFCKNQKLAGSAILSQHLALDILNILKLVSGEVVG